MADCRRPLAAQVKALGIGAPGPVFSTTNTDCNFTEIAELIAPQGRFGLIDDPPTFDIGVFKRKSVSIHLEFMFTCPVFETPDIAEQGALLNQVSKLVDDGVLQTTLGKNFGPVNDQNLKRAHTLLESGRAKGKIVLEGFDENRAAVVMKLRPPLVPSSSAVLFKPWSAEQCALFLKRRPVWP